MVIEEHAKNVYDVNYCSKKTDVVKNVGQYQTSISCFQHKHGKPTLNPSVLASEHSASICALVASSFKTV